MTRSGDVAVALGRGLVAGAIGTAAMTVSSSIEAKLRHREGSSAPADAASQVLGVEPTTDQGKARFSTVVHWSYGSAWGVMRGLLGLAGAPDIVAGVAHFATVWGSELVMLPRLGVAPPLSEWGSKELAIDAWHHTVYVTATSIAYRYLRQHTTSTP